MVGQARIRCSVSWPRPGATATLFFLSFLWACCHGPMQLAQRDNVKASMGQFYTRTTRRFIWNLTLKGNSAALLLRSTARISFRCLTELSPRRSGRRSRTFPTTQPLGQIRSQAVSYRPCYRIQCRCFCGSSTYFQPTDTTEGVKQSVTVFLYKPHKDEYAAPKP